MILIFNRRGILIEETTEHEHPGKQKKYIVSNSY